MGLIDMCAYSMIVDQGIRDLNEFPWPPVDVGGSRHSQMMAKLDEIVRLLESMMKNALEYDRATGQPDCEKVEKKEALRSLAEKLGVEINFPEASA